MKGYHFLILGFLTLLTCAFVWVRLQIVNISYDIHTLELKEHALREDCNRLTLKIDEAKSLQRLEQLARVKFHMHPPQANQVIILGK